MIGLESSRHLHAAAANAASMRALTVRPYCGCTAHGDARTVASFDAVAAAAAAAGGHAGAARKVDFRVRHFGGVDAIA